MKKNIKLITGLLCVLLAFTTSCSDEDVSVYGDLNGDYSSFQWYTGGNRETYRESNKEININQYVGLFDVSVGEKNREWTIPSSAKFLNQKFTESDTIYSSFVIPNSGTKSADELVNVYFPEAGEFEVKLRTEFKEPVTYTRSFEVGGELVSKSITSTVVDTIFKVKVFPDPVPTCKVYKQNFITNPEDPTGPTIVDEANPYTEILFVEEEDQPSLENIDTWAEVSIEAGEKLMFEDLSTIGEVDGTRWTTNGGKPEVSSKETIEVAYNKLTADDEYYTAHFISRRTSDVGPTKDIAKLIPLKIKVLPSTKPFAYNAGLKISKEGIISFPVTGEVELFDGQEDKFTVNVVNTDSGFYQNIAVSSVALNADDATIIELTLAEQVYNTDTFTISYTDANAKDTDGIISVDGRSLESFDPITTTIKTSEYEGVMNITDFTGYESEYGGSGNQYKFANMNKGVYFAQHNGNSEAGPLYYWRDTELAYEGNSSLKFETPSTGIPNLARLQGSAFKTLSPIPAGKFIPSVWVYIDPATTMSTIQYNCTTNVDATFNFDISTVEKGKWVQLNLPAVELPAIADGRLDINITNVDQGATQVQKLWLDNFDLLIVNDRP
ncbi:SwmB domain-containing protein [Wenyingzhuangia aestuarii]|uniref:SwmB domain-containing protein n=1 Tax=Wenyingzhuangia aestuarii TaxID=1647582 RepID=UPI00143B9E27|nr:SwmB domain-containing protein [Wenyingzhuangia aestuarii]NJB81653.1 hypothetical protein [Wenyingzhuangia aestuarii]